MLAANRQLLHLEFPWTCWCCHHGESYICIFSHLCVMAKQSRRVIINEQILNSVCRLLSLASVEPGCLGDDLT